MSFSSRDTLIKALESSKCLDESMCDTRVVAARRDVFFSQIPLQDALSYVSEERYIRARKYRFEKDQQLSILAALILDYLIDNYGLREKDMRYSFNHAGKPSFRDYPDLHFNLSHSGNIAVAAISKHPVGVDVEDVSSFPVHICNPYKWVALEAMGKAQGEGLSEEAIREPLHFEEKYRVNWYYVGTHAVCLCLATDEIKQGIYQR